MHSFSNKGYQVVPVKISEGNDVEPEELFYKIFNLDLSHIVNQPLE
jgi:hypothetical protein